METSPSEGTRSYFVEMNLNIISPLGLGRGAERGADCHRPQTSQAPKAMKLFYGGIIFIVASSRGFVAPGPITALGGATSGPRMKFSAKTARMIFSFHI